MRIAWRLVLGWSLLAGQGAALEPSSDVSSAARVEALRAEADRRFAAGEYRAALGPLNEGYAVTGDPRFLLNLGVTYHWLGECGRARDSYEQYLQAAPRGQYRAKALAALEALYAVCGHSVPNGPGSGIEPGLREVKAEPPPGPVQSAAPGRENAAPGSASMGASSQADARNEASNGIEAGAPSSASAPGNVMAWSLVSVGGAALVGAGVAALAWSRAHSEYEDLVADASGRSQSWDECCARRGEQLDSRAARYRVLTAGLGVASAVFITTGIVLWRDSDDSHPEVALELGEHAGLRVRGVF